MASLDATIVSTALKPIQEELHAPITWGAWTITAYNLAQVVVMPLAGKISDLYGRKRVFLCAAVIFAVSSLLCGMAQNIYVLVGLRALQAIGGGAFMPSASGIVADQYGRNKARALGLFTSIFSIGGVTGPVVGGFIVTYWSWRGIFFVNIPFSIVMIALAAVFLPSGTRQRGTRLDIWGAATLACFLLGAMFSITELGDGASALSARFLAPLVGALVAVTLFIRHSRRAEAPFVPARLLVGHGFGTMNLVNFVFGAFAIGTSALLPLYAQDHYGIPPLESGTLLTIRALGMICVTGLAVMVMHRTGYRRPILLGICRGFRRALPGLALPAGTCLALPVAWRLGRHHRPGHGRGDARREQRHPPSRAHPGRRGLGAARHVPPGRRPHRDLDRHRGSRPGRQPRSRAGGRLPLHRRRGAVHPAPGNANPG